MKIIVVSDTHGRDETFMEVLVQEETADLVIHCGDLEGTEDYFRQLTEDHLHCPLRMVAGNNDYFSSLPGEMELDIAGYKALVTHGHFYHVSMTTSLLRSEAVARGIRLAFFGHTHRPHYSQEDGVILINPGSLNYPRQSSRRPSYAVVTISEKGDFDCEIIEL